MYVEYRSPVFFEVLNYQYKVRLCPVTCDRWSHKYHIMYNAGAFLLYFICSRRYALILNLMYQKHGFHVLLAWLFIVTLEASLPITLFSLLFWTGNHFLIRTDVTSSMTSSLDF